METLTWQKDGPVEGRQALSSIREIVYARGQLVGVNVYGEVWRFDDKLGWRVEIKSAIPSGVGIQVYANAWDDKLCGFGSDGRVLTLEQGTALTWRTHSEPEPKFAFKGPIGAYDPSRKIMVVWGPKKSDGSRKDETFVFDGNLWKKGKKAKAPPAELAKTDGGAFTVVYDPAGKQVVRVGVTEVAYFDGTSWRTVPLGNGKALGTWERMPCVDEASKTVLLIQRHVSDLNVVKLELGPESARAVVVATVPSAVTRNPNDAGGNVAFDQHAYDPARRQLVAFDTKLGFRYVADLAPYFGS
ncbi:MAG: hypothetical protein JWO36_3523 [Myxococcales bacterium]|nr:hypothetical protein [Myxococcales bacterium]